MGVVKGSGKSDSFLFSRDPDTLPFFSIHNKTLVGKILRIALCVFFVIVLILEVLARTTGLLYSHYFDYSYLIYVVPGVILLALITLALVKRIPIRFFKVVVVVIAIVFGMSVVSTLCQMMGFVCSLQYAPEMTVVADGTTFTLMRQCDLEGYVDENGAPIEDGGSLFEKGVTSLKRGYSAFPTKVRIFIDARAAVKSDFIVYADQILEPSDLGFEKVSDNQFHFWMLDPAKGEGDIWVNLDGTPFPEEAEAAEQTDNAPDDEGEASPAESNEATPAVSDPAEEEAPVSSEPVIPAET